MDLNININTD
jgi:hypothetical protein